MPTHLNIQQCNDGVNAADRRQLLFGLSAIQCESKARGAGRRLAACDGRGKGGGGAVAKALGAVGLAVS